MSIRPIPTDSPIVLQEVTRAFAQVRAIDAISLAVPRGTILGLIGPSGSGKTTTIRTLTGALAPTSGIVRVLGEDPRRFHRRTRERIGYSPQDFVLYQDLTARENVDFMGSLFGMLWRRRRRRVREALELVGLWEARDRRASQLSGGMRRRLELACALVHDPEVLFLDEPTAGIDPILRQTVWQELRRLRDEGRTLLVTTQYVAEAEHCDAVALLSHGRLIALARPEDLRRQALGGDVIEVEVDRPFDARSLAGVEGVTAVRQRDPRSVLVVAENAGMVTPRVVDAIDSLGADVVSSREYRPTFDEVFAELVSRDRLARGLAPDDAEAA
ncbi:MAG TPA: ABC transporter ATP-binding protein [Candidatus Limnocylindrales bacterium]|nr:ABC transporter ATP-binding protein [Candidatus Limnocylindrales bacterium]